MLRGTRIIPYEPDFSCVVAVCRMMGRRKGYEELIFPSIWKTDTFVAKAGPEILGQMYTFKDKGDRDVCLIPEVTAIIQEQWKAGWIKEKKKPYRVSYLARCYRYERPQAGRYREFWQWGCEYLGNGEEGLEEIQTLLKDTLDHLALTYKFNNSVKRGLDYYVEDGFEAECDVLGAQKQIAGGGRYDCGVGFAIGIDRVLEVTSKENKE